MVSIDNTNSATANGNGHVAAKLAVADASTVPSAPESNGSQLEFDASRKRKWSIMPLEVGTRVNCRWRDGKYHPVKVIERRKLVSGGANYYEYYVHYTECEKLFSYTCFLDWLGI